MSLNPPSYQDGGVDASARDSDLAIRLGDPGVRVTLDPRFSTTSISGFTSGNIYIVPIPVYAGDVLSSIIVTSAGTALTAGTGADAKIWAAIYDTAGNLLQQSNVDSSNSWPVNSAKTFTLAAPVRPARSGLVYVAVMIYAGSGTGQVMPTLTGSPAGASANNVLAAAGALPILRSTSTGGSTSVAPSPLSGLGTVTNGVLCILVK